MPIWLVSSTKHTDTFLGDEFQLSVYHFYVKKLYIIRHTCFRSHKVIVHVKGKNLQAQEDFNFINLWSLQKPLKLNDPCCSIQQKNFIKHNCPKQRDLVFHRYFHIISRYHHLLRLQMKHIHHFIVKFLSVTIVLIGEHLAIMLIPLLNWLVRFYNIIADE